MLGSTDVARRLVVLALALPLALSVAVAGPASAGPRPYPADSPRLTVYRPSPSTMAPRAVIWLLCCGLWSSQETAGADIDVPGSGPPDLPHPRAAVDWWRARGFIVANFGYRDGRRSVSDAVDAYRILRRRFPGLKLCAVGGSASAHVALMVAVFERLRGDGRGPDCVVAEAVPAHLPSLPPASIALGRRYLGARANLRLFSPRPFARHLRSSIAIATCAHDPLVPAGNSYSLLDRVGRHRRSGQLLWRRGVPASPLAQPPAAPGHELFAHFCQIDFATASAYRAWILDFVREVRRLAPAARALDHRTERFASQIGR